MKLPCNLDLKTRRLCLRPLQAGDEHVLWPDMADHEVSQWMAWTPHRHLSETEAFVAHEVERCAAGRGVTWLVEEGRTACGIFSLIGLARTHRALTYDRAEAAYWLGTAHRGRGLATEAGRAVLGFAFGALGLHKVHVSHFGVNAASRALIQRLGFRHVGVQRQEFQKDGVWHDHHLYELLSHEFNAGEDVR